MKDLKNDIRFRGLKPFEKKIWLASPTMHGEEQKWINDAFEKNWIDNWQRNGWKNSSKHDVENQDLWKQLLVLTNKHHVTFHKVKGHADNELNNRCDELARKAIKDL